MKHHMKRILVLLAAAVLYCSCSPQAYLMLLELRQPSESGLFLDDKSMAVVYLNDGSARDSVFCNCFADGFARGLEAEYFDGKTAVDIYDAVKVPGVDYTCKDSLQSLVLKLDKDVVFLVDTPTYSEGVDGKMKAHAAVYAYDSMYEKDMVLCAFRNSLVSDFSVTDSLFPSDAQFLGLQTSKSFLDTWSQELFSVVYFEGSLDEGWYNAIEYAELMRWSDAREIWMNLARKYNGVKQACASYNVALACFMLREYDLAIEWLDFADEVQVISLSKGLRERINKEMQK